MNNYISPYDSRSNKYVYGNEQWKAWQHNTTFNPDSNKSVRVNKVVADENVSAPLAELLNEHIQ